MGAVGWDVIHWWLMIGWFWYICLEQRQPHAPEFRPPGFRKAPRPARGSNIQDDRRLKPQVSTVAGKGSSEPNIETWKPDVEDVEDVWKRPQAFLGVFSPLVFRNPTRRVKRLTTSGGGGSLSTVVQIGRIREGAMERHDRI